MKKLIVLMPVYNDWAAASVLARELDSAFLLRQDEIKLVVIDDGSDEPMPETAFPRHFERIRTVEVVRLKRNLGHQRAIAVGLVHIHTQAKGSDYSVIVMDSDGEDQPVEAVRLLDELRRGDSRQVVFASRTHRCEGVLFKLAYFAYRSAFRLLTGQKIRFGNFSALSARHVDVLVVCSETWVNYPAAVIKARIPHTAVETSKGHRYAGKSRMSLAGLFLHGFSAMSVYNDVIGVRVVYFVLVMLAVLSAGLMTTVGIRLATNAAIPGWATYTAGVLAIMVLQSVTMGFSFLFTVLGNRMAATVLPLREAPVFIDRVDILS